MTDRFLEGNGYGYIEVGLPNITGTFGLTLDSGETGTTTGAFITERIASMWNYQSNGGVWKNTLDASRSSSIYGNSTTVQPATCKCYFVIKY